MRLRVPALAIHVFAAIAAFLILGCLTQPATALDAKSRSRILILHSYHIGHDWTDLQADGISDAINAFAPDSVQEIYYLDWKRYPEVSSLDAMEDLLRQRFAAKIVDLIVTTDDAALSFALRIRPKIFGNEIPILFSGVKAGAPTLLGNPPNLTGVYEAKDIEGTLRMALEANPAYRNVYLIRDDTETSLQTEHALRRVIDGIGVPLTLHTLSDLPIDALRQKLAGLGPDSFALFIAYSPEAGGLNLPHGRFLELMSAGSAVPIFGLQSYLLKYGLTGGSLLDGDRYRAAVGQLIRQVLSGARVEALPLQAADVTRRVIDYRQAERYGLPLDGFSRLDQVVNKPFSFVETYRSLVIAVAAALLLLSALVVWLTLVVRQRLRAERALQGANAALIASRVRLQDSVVELTASQTELKRSEQRLRLIAEAARDIIWSWDVRSEERSLSGRVREVLGYDAESLTRMQAWDALVHPDDRAGAADQLLRHLRGDTAEYRAEYRIRHRDGHLVWLCATGKALFDEQGRPVVMAGSYTDITAERERQAWLDRMAHFDQVTGLPNRVRLSEHVDAWISSGHMDTASHDLALLFLDMDNFKFINDSFGHKAGDRLLVAFGQRLKALAGEGVMVSRLGGDEFVIVLEGEAAGDIQGVCRRIEESFRAPFVIEGQNFFVTSSIGVARYPWDGRSFDELLQNADTAMYWSKDGGRGRVSMFTPEMNRNVVERVRLLSRMRTAMESNAFSLHYQPQVATRNGAILGFEALVRWTDRELGPVSPARFIPACEETGMIIPLGLWVLEGACRQAMALIETGMTGLKMSVNVSVVQLSQHDFVRQVLEVLERTGLPPANLQLEITESLVIGSLDTAVGKLTELRKAGVQIALDDFGTGYSSLTYLRRLPIHTLKLDRGFIDEVTEKPEARNLVASILRIASDLSHTVVAEGVEDLAQWEALSRLGCDLIQGYFVSRPLPADQLGAFIAGWEKRRPALPLLDEHGTVIGMPARQGH
ncbi:EAL domain-containing protein [Azospirillum thermophilum]|uniref:EAL domain-containing protein n=1 Tax=Azospirillum thermophilum TaxID=2202148 RepID=UPI0011B43C23|nr:EAL domain-containing protein [Azospirillum thermophilum]